MASRQRQIELISATFFDALLAGDAKAARRLHVPAVVWGGQNDRTRHARLAAAATLIPDLLPTIDSVHFYDDTPPRSKTHHTLKGFTKACGLAFNTRLQDLAADPAALSASDREHLTHCASALLGRLTQEEERLQQKGAASEFPSAQSLPASFWMHVPAEQREQFFEGGNRYGRRAVIGTMLWEHGIALGWPQAAQLGRDILDTVLTHAPAALHTQLRERMSLSVALSAAEGGPLGVAHLRENTLSGWESRPQDPQKAQAQFLARAQCVPALIEAALDWAQALSPITWSKTLVERGPTPAGRAAESLNTVAWSRIPKKDKQERYTNRLNDRLLAPLRRVQPLPAQADALWSAASGGTSPNQGWTARTAPWAALTPLARAQSFSEALPLFCRTNGRALLKQVLPDFLQRDPDFNADRTLSAQDEAALEDNFNQWRTGPGSSEWAEAQHAAQSFARFFLTAPSPIFEANALSQALDSNHLFDGSGANHWAARTWRESLMLPALLDNGATAQVNDGVWAQQSPQVTARVEHILLEHELRSVRAHKDRPKTQTDSASLDASASSLSTEEPTRGIDSLSDVPLDPLARGRSRRL